MLPRKYNERWMTTSQHRDQSWRQPGIPLRQFAVDSICLQKSLEQIMKYGESIGTEVW